MSLRPQQQDMAFWKQHYAATAEIQKPGRNPIKGGHSKKRVSGTKRPQIKKTLVSRTGPEDIYSK